jgi:Na+/melibiose symporter-like transporter
MTVRVKLSDIFRLIKENKALRIKIRAGVFGGFMWTFMFAAGAYYIKWAYCADLTTGVVDTGLYGVFSMVGAALSLVPIIVGTVIAIPLMKAIGSALKIYRLMLLIEMASCAVMFILQMAGILQHTPALYFICSSITGLAIGINFIPEETLNIEVMDYEIYLHGKDRSALCNNACNKFLNKAQSAVASAIIGILLGSIGYVVDSATDTYIGELSALPSMLNWFIVITGLIPVMLGIVAWLISGRYPVTSEIRNDMKRKLSENAQ